MVALAAVVLLLQEAEPLWETHATAPGVTSRNNVWHSGFNVPPFEEAHTARQGVLAARAWLDASMGDFRETDEGGRSTWQNLTIEELVQIDYAVGESWQAGLRFSTGKVVDQHARPVEAFDDGEVVTDDLDRRFDAGSIVLRGKYADVWTEAFDWGVLAELKIPLSERRNPLTAATVDLGVSLLASRQIADRLWVHANAGIVAPFGDTDFFRRDDDPRAFFTWAAGASWRARPWLTLYGQVEGNTGAFAFKEIDRSATTVGAGGRADLGRGYSIDATVGLGFDEFSSRWTVAIGLNLALRP